MNKTQGKLIKEAIEHKIETGILGIYKLWNPRFPDLVYYGSSRNIRRRLLDHCRKLEAKKHKNYKMQRLYNMFEFEFRWEIIETYVNTADNDDLCRKREESFINFPKPNENLLNIDRRTYRYKRK